MKSRDSDPASLLPLTPAAFHILLALVDGEKHGYGIMVETARRSEGRMNLGPGTLYRSLRRLASDGLIEESEERPVTDLDDERRHYYRITPFGLRIAGAEAERLAALVRAAEAAHLLPSAPRVVTLEGGGIS